MRITDDYPEGYADQQAKYKPTPSPNDIMSKLKTQSTVNDSVQTQIEPESKTVKVDVKGAKLNSLLCSIKAQNMTK